MDTVRIQKCVWPRKPSLSFVCLVHALPRRNARCGMENGRWEWTSCHEYHPPFPLLSHTRLVFILFSTPPLLFASSRHSPFGFKISCTFSLCFRLKNFTLCCLARWARERVIMDRWVHKAKSRTCFRARALFAPCFLSLCCPFGCQVLQMVFCSSYYFYFFRLIYFLNLKQCRWPVDVYHVFFA